MHSKSKRLKAFACRAKTELHYMTLQTDSVLNQIQKIKAQGTPETKKDLVTMEAIIVSLLCS